jgi:hypothetical protein
MYQEMNEQINRMKLAHATASDPDSECREHAIILLECAVGRCLEQLESQDSDEAKYMLWSLMGWNR